MRVVRGDVQEDHTSTSRAAATSPAGRPTPQGRPRTSSGARPSTRATCNNPLRGLQLGRLSSMGKPTSPTSNVRITAYSHMAPQPKRTKNRALGTQLSALQTLSWHPLYPQSCRRVPLWLECVWVQSFKAHRLVSPSSQPPLPDQDPAEITRDERVVFTFRT